MIKKHAEVHIQDVPRLQLSDDDMVGDVSDDEDSYPHAHLIIDWYVESLNWMRQEKEFTRFAQTE